mgnify:CR=1 FL=1
MGLFNLSSVKNHPRRSGFDLSSKVAFSAKDKFNLKLVNFFQLNGL